MRADLQGAGVPRLFTGMPYGRHPVLGRIRSRGDMARDLTTPTSPVSRLETGARARVRATVATGIAVTCLAAAGSYVQTAYVRPYLAVRRLCA